MKQKCTSRKTSRTERVTEFVNAHIHGERLLVIFAKKAEAAEASTIHRASFGYIANFLPT